MASFDEIKDKLSQTGQDAVKKAKCFADVTRLNASVYAEERIRNNLYQEIGRIFYSENNDAPPERYSELFASVAESEKKISGMKAEILKTKELKICPKCKEKCSSSADYCHRCGAELPKSEACENNKDNGSEQTVYCSGCGAACPADAVICTNCGEKLI
ncbi:MAG: zinc ribbon domain-containing protein [Firmicutes bacterium]|nr:zinc ribbon domain-containing protein [Bacillota bacterium]